MWVSYRQIYLQAIRGDCIHSSFLGAIRGESLSSIDLMPSQQPSIWDFGQGFPFSRFPETGDEFSIFISFSD
jgi:hypothetical protein